MAGAVAVSEAAPVPAEEEEDPELELPELDLGFDPAEEGPEDEVDPSALAQFRFEERSEEPDDGTLDVAELVPRLDALKEPGADAEEFLDPMVLVTGVVEEPKTSDEDDGEAGPLLATFTLPDTLGDGLDEEPWTDPVLLSGIGAELVEEQRFEQKWSHAEPASRVLRTADGLLALGANRVELTHAGVERKRAAAPERIVSVAWNPSELVDFGLGVLAVSSFGRLFELGEDSLRELDRAGLPSNFEPRRAERVGALDLVAGADGRWFSRGADGFRPAFDGLPLPALCPLPGEPAGEHWLAIEERDFGHHLFALRGSMHVPVAFAGALDASAELHAFGNVIALRDTEGRLWLSETAGAEWWRVEPSFPSEGLCFGRVDGQLRLWTTMQPLDRVLVIEVDVATRSALGVATLPWLVDEDDTPRVTALVWLEAERLLCVASDRGVVGLGRES